MIYVTESLIIVNENTDQNVELESFKFNVLVCIFIQVEWEILFYSSVLVNDVGVIIKTNIGKHHQSVFSTGVTKIKRLIW